MRGRRKKAAAAAAGTLASVSARLVDQSVALIRAIARSFAHLDRVLAGRRRRHQVGPGAVLEMRSWVLAGLEVAQHAFNDRLVCALTMRAGYVPPYSRCC